VIQQANVQIEVVEVQSVADRIVIVAQVRSGEPDATTVLASATGDASWRVLGTAFTPPDAWKEGKRGLLVVRVSGTRDPVSGEVLSGSAPPR
jgi:hypothetical protein